MLTIEPARPTDADAVVALLDAAAAWQERAGFPQWRRGQFVDEVAEMIAGGYQYVGRLDGVVVGCFLLDGEHPEWIARWLSEHGLSADGAHLSRLAVARAHAGRGLGGELVDAACDIAAARALPVLRLDCPAENSGLRRFYARLGFAHRGDIAITGPAGEQWVSSLYERPTRERCEGAVLVGGKILLVRHQRADGRAFWNLPGGGRFDGESDRECARRELFEETHLEVEVGEMLLREPGARRTFLCSIRSGDARLGAEPEPGHSTLTALAWVSLEQPDTWHEEIRDDPIIAGVLAALRRRLEHADP